MGEREGGGAFESQGRASRARSEDVGDEQVDELGGQRGREQLRVRPAAAEPHRRAEGGVLGGDGTHRCGVARREQRGAAQRGGGGGAARGAEQRQLLVVPDEADEGEAVALDVERVAGGLGVDGGRLLEQRGHLEVEGRLEGTHRLEVGRPLAGGFELHHEAQRRRARRGGRPLVGRRRREGFAVAEGGGGGLDVEEHERQPLQPAHRHGDRVKGAHDGARRGVREAAHGLARRGGERRVAAAERAADPRRRQRVVALQQVPHLVGIEVGVLGSGLELELGLGLGLGLGSGLGLGLGSGLGLGLGWRRSRWRTSSRTMPCRASGALSHTRAWTMAPSLKRRAWLLSPQSALHAGSLAASEAAGPRSTRRSTFTVRARVGVGVGVGVQVIR